MKSGENCSSSFKNYIILYSIHVYSPGQGQVTPRGQNFDCTVKPVLSKHQRERQKVVAEARCLLNTGKFTHIWPLWDLKNTGGL